MKKETGNLISFIILCVVAVLLMAVTVITSFDFESDNLEVTFVNTGQGDCAYIKTPNKTRIMIDGGEYESYDKYIKKFLARKMVSNIDIGIISHFHSDHAGGLTDAIEAGVIRSVIAPESGKESLVEEKVKDACKERNIPITRCGFDDVAYEDEDGVKIKVLFPNKGIFRNSEDDYNENNNSLVLMLEYAGRKFLFTGDAEKVVEKELCSVFDLSADVLKVPHHGSGSSSSKDFIEAVSPEYAVVSCGAYNSYGFPNSSVTYNLEKSGALIFRTDLNGDITFLVDSEGNLTFKKEH